MGTHLHHTDGKPAAVIAPKTTSILSMEVYSHKVYSQSVQSQYTVTNKELFKCASCENNHRSSSSLCKTIIDHPDHYTFILVTGQFAQEQFARGQSAHGQFVQWTIRPRTIRPQLLLSRKNLRIYG